MRGTRQMQQTGESAPQNIIGQSERDHKVNANKNEIKEGREANMQ